MDTKFDFTDNNADRIVYVRPVLAEDLPDEVRAQIGATKELYAVHNAQGERLALVKDRAMAFALARENDLAPVTVH